MIRILCRGYDDKGIYCELAHDSDRNLFMVTVSKGHVIKKENFWAEYPVDFGIDLVDMAEFDRVSLKLAAQLEKELGI